MRTSRIAPFALALSVLSGAAFAAGEPPPGGDTQPSPTITKCKKGSIWDEKKKACAPAKRGAVDDDSIYAAGRDLAYAERHQEAIDVLKAAQNQNDPRILTYLGYSSRKLGNVGEGMRYYHAAIAANPKYSLVREYLGEAYLQIGDLNAAKGQLATIKQLCGPRACLEYKDLAEEIAEYERARL